MEIRKSGSQPSGKGPEEYFAGNVRTDTLSQAHEPSRVSCALVTFEPGARSAWHWHPLGHGEESVSVAMEEIQPEGWAEKVYQPDIVNNPEKLYKKPGYAM
jgi:hypothetical protein